MTQTYSEFATARMDAAAATFPEGDRTFCDEGKEAIASQTALDAYNQENPHFWFWALSELNPEKRNELINTMLQRVLDAGAACPHANPIEDPRGFFDWYTANKAKLRKNGQTESCDAAFLYAARLVLDDKSGLEGKAAAFMQMTFVGSWVSAMNDQTNEPEGDILNSLAVGGGDWFRSQCTFEEFCNELVED